MDELKIAFGTWLKYPAQNLISFISPDAAKTHASVDDGEIAFDYSFINRQATTTAYTLQMRRSTLRFKGSFEWQDQPEPAKSKGTNTATRHTTSGSENSGYCAEFKE